MKEKEWYSTGEAAKIAGYDRKTITRKILKGELGATRIGSGRYAHWRIPKESLDAFLKVIR
jgi:excisionase family DNA binding protein